MRRPCPQCPFLRDSPTRLRNGRVREIQRSLERSEFPCHKTLDYSEGDGEGRKTRATQHCAGALILLEKLEAPSQMMRIAGRLGMYDPSALDMEAPVVDSFEEMMS